MVEILLRGLGGDQRQGGAANPAAVACYHIDSRMSDALEEIGGFQPRKLWRAVRYGLEAVWCRLRWGAEVLYFVPASGKWSAVLRDIVMLGLCRPFYPRLILHFHAPGLGEWLQKAPAPVRALHRLVCGRPILALVLDASFAPDAEFFGARRIVVLPNGIEDPCPEAAALVARRQERARRRMAGGAEPFRLLFLAHCTEEKGVFEAVEAVRLANSALAAEGCSWRFELTVAGGFLDSGEEGRLRAAIARAEVESGSRGLVRYAGFADAATKQQLLEEGDALFFPTHYPHEGLPVAVIEALAYGQVPVLTRWKALPGIFPSPPAFFAGVGSPGEQVQALRQAAVEADFAAARRLFEQEFTAAGHLRRLAEALVGSSLQDPHGAD